MLEQGLQNRPADLLEETAFLFFRYTLLARKSTVSARPIYFYGRFARQASKPADLANRSEHIQPSY